MSSEPRVMTAPDPTPNPTGHAPPAPPAAAATAPEPGGIRTPSEARPPRDLEGGNLLARIAGGEIVPSVIHPELDAEQAELEILDFNLWYGAKQALFHNTLSIPRGKVTALIGPSGCGKSTLLRSVNRLNDLLDIVRIKGDMTLNGDSIYDPSVDVIELRKRMGMVFQKPNPFPMSIFENVVYPLRIDGERSRSTLEGEPEVLLLDEPCSALDPIATGKIEELIRELRGHYTILIVTHNMQQAQRCSDYTALMYLGQILEAGPTVSIFTNPRRKETEDYVTGRFG